MDVEGLEYGLLPSLLLRGTLCGGGVDFISVEAHPHLAPTPRLAGGSPLVSSERDAKVVFKYLHCFCNFQTRAPFLQPLSRKLNFRILQRSCSFSGSINQRISKINIYKYY